MGDKRTLLVLCTAFRGKSDKYPNLTVKKIPKQVLARCEWGHDDYSLQVENLPKAPRQARTAEPLRRGGSPMNRHVNAIAGRLSLRPPQRRSLEILDRIAEIVPPQKTMPIRSCARGDSESSSLP